MNRKHRKCRVPIRAELEWISFDDPKKPPSVFTHERLHSGNPSTRTRGNLPVNFPPFATLEIGINISRNESRMRKRHRAGGVFIFCVAGPGRLLAHGGMGGGTKSLR